MNDLNIAKATKDFALIRSGNGKWHGFNRTYNAGRSYIVTHCGKTVFHRKPPIFKDNVALFEIDGLTCKQCQRSARKAIAA